MDTIDALRDRGHAKDHVPMQRMLQQDTPEDFVTITGVKIAPRYFRPAEVETLLGDPSKAKQKLGWVPEITAQETCRDVVRDLAQAKQHALLRASGYAISVSVE